LRVKNEGEENNLKYTLCFDDLEIYDLGDLKNKKGYFFLKCKEE
jgi:hypothetical protein